MKIYADNAATTKMSQTAIDAMMPYITDYFGNPSSLYSKSQITDRPMYRRRALGDHIHLRRLGIGQPGHIDRRPAR